MVYRERDVAVTDRRILLWLLASGMFNIALVAYVTYDYFADRSPVMGYRNPIQVEELVGTSIPDERSNEDVVADLRRMSFNELVDQLGDTTLLEDGYTVRDLALASLVSFHHFDLQRALLGQPQPSQQRQLVIGAKEGVSSSSLLLYPGLSESQFLAIARFAASERWPLTSLGLFLRLNEAGLESDPTLREAFYLTPEFLAVERLFNRCKPIVDKSDILALVLGGEWAVLSRFGKMQQRRNEASDAQRRELLLDYLASGVASAATLLLRTDGAFVRKKLDDPALTRIVESLDPADVEAQRLALDLLSSPRGDVVLVASAALLYRAEGGMPPDSIEPGEVVQRFAPKRVLDPSMLQAKDSPEMEERMHVVERGDSLWKISRRYNVSIEAIKEANGLQSDFLKPGKKLVIRSR